MEQPVMPTMSTWLNILALLCFAIAAVLYGLRILRAFKRDGWKGGLIARGNWRLWGLGTVFVLGGGALHYAATRTAPPDAGLAAEQQAMAAALSGPSASSTASAATPSTHQAAQKLPPDDPRALWAMQHAGASGPVGGAVDDTTFPYPTAAGVKSPDGYPVYLIECNAHTHQCVGPMGHPIGTATQVATQLTPVRNVDALRFQCPDNICTDGQGNVIGSVALTMRPYLEH